MPIKSKELEGDCVPLTVVLDMSPEHDSDFKVLSMRRDGEEDLGVVIETVVVIVDLGSVV